MDQLPDEVQDKLYSHFLFLSFTTTFTEMFRVPKYGIDTLPVRNSVNIPVKAELIYNWDDQNFREFMMEILTNLEPRFIPRDRIIFKELEEIYEVLFVSKGNVDVGFEINRRQKFVLRFSNKVIIGGYNCTFNKKTIFVFKSKTDVSGHMLRKKVWLSLMNEYGHISEYFKKNIENTYLKSIKNKMMDAKTKYLNSIEG